MGSRRCKNGFSASSAFRGQAALESMVLFAGLFAFVSVLWSASLPLQDASALHAQRLQQQAVFEKVRFAVRLAAASAPGFSMFEEFSLARNATLSWTTNTLTWSGSFFNNTVNAPFVAPGVMTLSAGRHRLRVRRTHAVELEAG